MYKTAIITGANSGIGFETCLAFAKKDIHVIMACRNLEKAAQAKNKILENFPKARLEIEYIDLSSFKSVRSFAAKILKKYSKLDLLINNAGFMARKFELTEDGNESQFQANFLSHFLLTSLLLPLIKQSKNARIVSLSSMVHYYGTINTEHINDKTKYKSFKGYANSKMACLIFAKSLQKKFDKENIAALSLAAHPGISLTNISNDLHPSLIKLRNKFAHYFFATPKQGAESIIYAALHNDVQGGKQYGPSGFLEMKGKPKQAKCAKYSRREDISAILWAYATSKTKATFDETKTACAKNTQAAL